MDKQLNKWYIIVMDLIDSQPATPTPQPVTTTTPQLPDLSPAQMHELEQLPEESIFKQAAFPHHTKPFRYTPQQILALLWHYESTHDDWDHSCIKCGIVGSQYWEIKNIFPEITERHARARQNKTDIWATEIPSIIDDDSNDLLTVEGKYGTYNTPNSAAVRRSELRFKGRFAMIERLNAAFSPKLVTTNRNLTATINITPDQASNTPLADILGNNDQHKH